MKLKLKALAICLTLGISTHSPPIQADDWEETLSLIHI